MAAIEAVLLRYCNNQNGDVFKRLRSSLNEETTSSSTAQCTKRCFSLLCERLNKELHVCDQDHVSILLEAVRGLASPENTNFSKFFSYGLPGKQWMTTLSSHSPHTAGWYTVMNDLLFTIQTAAEYSSSACAQLHVLIPGSLRVAANTNCIVLSRMEACRVLNVLLDNCSIVKKNQLKSKANVFDNIQKTGSTLTQAGDYELQSALLEVLFRFSSDRERELWGRTWFGRLSDQFVKIRENEFESDCRIFLNALNLSCGDKRKVHSLNCLKCVVGDIELHQPPDSDQFWCDVNLTSKCVTMYVADPNNLQGMWETVLVPVDKVKSWTIKDVGVQQELCFSLSTPLLLPWSSQTATHSSSITFFFSTTSLALNVVSKVFGGPSRRLTTMKASVACTPLLINYQRQHISSVNEDSRQISPISPNVHTPAVNPSISSQHSATPTRPLPPQTPHTSTPRALNLVPVVNPANPYVGTTTTSASTTTGAKRTLTSHVSSTNYEVTTSQPAKKPRKHQTKKTLSRPAKKSIVKENSSTMKEKGVKDNYEGRKMGKVVEEKKSKVVEEKKSKVVEEKKSKVVEEKKSKVGEEKKSKVGEEKKSKVGEEKKSKVVEEKKSKIGEEKKSKVGEEKKSKVGEEKKSKVVEEKKSKVGEEKKSKVGEEKKSKVGEEKKSKVVEEKKSKVVEEKKSKVGEEKRKVVEKKSKVVEKKNKVVEEKRMGRKSKDENEKRCKEEKRRDFKVSEEDKENGKKTKNKKLTFLGKKDVSQLSDITNRSFNTSSDHPKLFSMHTAPNVSHKKKTTGVSAKLSPDSTTFNYPDSPHLKLGKIIRGCPNVSHSTIELVLESQPLEVTEEAERETVTDKARIHAEGKKKMNDICKCPKKAPSRKKVEHSPITSRECDWNQSPALPQSGPDSSPELTTRRHDSSPVPRTGTCDSPRTGRCNSSSAPRTGTCDSSPVPKTRRHDSSPVPRTGRRDSSPVPRTGRRDSSPVPKTRRRDSSPAPKTRKRDSSPVPKTRKRDSSPVLRTGRRDSSPAPKTRRRDSSPVPRTGRRDSLPVSKTCRHDSSPVPKTRRRDSSPVPRTGMCDSSPELTTRRRDSSSPAPRIGRRDPSPVPRTGRRDSPRTGRHSSSPASMTGTRDSSPAPRTSRRDSLPAPRTDLSLKAGRRRHCFSPSDTFDCGLEGATDCSIYCKTKLVETNKLRRSSGYVSLVSSPESTSVNDFADNGSSILTTPLSTIDSVTSRFQQACHSLLKSDLEVTTGCGAPPFAHCQPIQGKPVVETVPKEQEVKEVVYSRPSSITSPCSSLRSSFTDSVSAVSGPLSLDPSWQPPQQVSRKRKAVLTTSAVYSPTKFFKSNDDVPDMKQSSVQCRQRKPSINKINSVKLNTSRVLGKAVRSPAHSLSTLTVVWNRQQQERFSLLTNYEQQLLAKLSILEGTTHHENPHIQTLFKQQMKKLTGDRRIQDNYLCELQALYHGYCQDLSQVEFSQVNEQNKVQVSLRRDFGQLQQRVMSQSQKRHISHFKQTLDALLLHL